MWNINEVGKTSVSTKNLGLIVAPANGRRAHRALIGRESRSYRSHNPQPGHHCHATLDPFLEFLFLERCVFSPVSDITVQLPIITLVFTASPCFLIQVEWCYIITRYLNNQYIHPSNSFIQVHNSFLGLSSHYLSVYMCVCSL